MKNVLALKDFVVKKTFQDTCLQCTSLASIVGPWSHSLLLKELTDLPLISCKKSQGIYLIYMEAEPILWMGVLHQTMSGLIGTSYRGDPLG